MKQDSLDSPVHDSLSFVFMGTKPLGFSQKAASLAYKLEDYNNISRHLEGCVDSPSDLLIL